jgi:uncharacterized membrane protein YkgB
MNINSIDQKLIRFCNKVSIPFARFAIFIVFFWFGALKVVGLSPASSMVQALFETTMPIMSFSVFIVLFGVLEMVIGLLFLLPGAERAVLPVLFFHMATTFMPLVFLPSETWSGFLVPTLEGQYIIKNVLIIALAIVVASQLRPMDRKTR